MNLTKDLWMSFDLFLVYSSSISLQYFFRLLPLIFYPSSILPSALHDLVSVHDLSASSYNQKDVTVLQFSGHKVAQCDTSKARIGYRLDRHMIMV